MSRSPKFAAVAAVLVLFGLGGWWVQSLISSGSDERGARDSASSGPDSRLAGVEPDAASDRTSADAERARAGRSAPGPTVLAGVVVPDRPLPADEELFVLGLDERGHVACECQATGDGRFTLVVVQSVEALDVRARYAFRTEPIRLERARATGAEHSLSQDSPDVAVPVTIGARLVGRVVGPATDFAAATVALGPVLDGNDSSRARRSAATPRRAVLANDGAFEFHAIDPAPAWFVGALVPGSPPLEMEPLWLTAGVTREVTLTSEAGCVIRGSVVDTAGQGLPAAEVVLRDRVISDSWSGIDDAVSDRVGCDASGHFEWTGLAPGDYRVYATVEGMLRGAWVDVPLREAGAVRDGVELVLETGHAVAGALHWWDGEPAANASLRVAFREGTLAEGNWSRGPSGSASADEHGTFVITGLVPAQFVVDAFAERATADGTESGFLHLPSVDASPLGTAPARYELLPTATLRGRVVTRGGGSVPSFTLTLTHRAEEETRGAEPWPELEFTSAAPDGRFEVNGMVHGDWTLRCTAPGFADAEPLLLQQPDAERNDWIVELVPECRVLGVVFDPDGAPVAGARVWCTDLEGLDAAERAPDATPWAQTDPSGRFELSALAPGSWSLTAVAADFAPSAVLPLELEVGAVVEDAELTLSLGGAIEGRVLREDGTGAVARTVWTQLGSPRRSHFTRTDEQGGFRLPGLLPGSWKVYARGSRREIRADGRNPGSLDDLMRYMDEATVDVREGETTSVVLGAPPEKQIEVSGRVHHGGDGVRSIVQFLADGTAEAVPTVLAESGVDGHYDVVLETHGPFLAVVQTFGNPRGAAEFHVIVPEEGDPALDLELPSAALGGVILGPDDAPVAGVLVTLEPTDSFSGRSPLTSIADAKRSGTDGRFAFELLEAGDYRLCVQGVADTDGGATLGGRCLESLRLEQGEQRTDLEIRLHVGGSIRGRVLHPDGRPAAMAALYLRDDQGRVLNPTTRSHSDEHGEFTLGGIAEGQYHVQAILGERASPVSRAVAAGPGRAPEIELQLEAASFLIVSAHQRGEPLRVQVRVNDRAGRSFTNLRDFRDPWGGRQGRYDSFTRRIGPLPPETYDVVLTAADGATHETAVLVDGTRTEYEVVWER